jgi:phage shock protein PspC (stress-responsive transcriptional regulator)
MRRYSGHIFGVCSTLGEFLGVNPWILRVLAVCFFSKVFGTYVILGIMFSLFLEDNDEIIKKEKQKEKREKKKLEASKTEYITSDTFKEKTFSERRNGNLLKDE